MCLRSVLHQCVLSVLMIVKVHHPEDWTCGFVLWSTRSEIVTKHNYALLDTSKTSESKLDACTSSAATVKKKLKLSLELQRRLRSPMAKGFKAPLQPSSRPIWMKFLENVKQ
ncbi:uncharacterized protein LOC142796175 isoform X2 [Rhipicephalus microplus]|uniref:uncharacterized protein LOC142796175 isoform X2 n=1 Tax=Rhipicephalus microplus TaxID=6941 RepID=UPI003F6AE21B